MDGVGAWVRRQIQNVVESIGHLLIVVFKWTSVCVIINKRSLESFMCLDLIRTALQQQQQQQQQQQ